MMNGTSASQQRGATALHTAEAQVPITVITLSTSISLWAARTPFSGLVWLSSVTSWTWRPSTPPAAFTSSITSFWLALIEGPQAPPAPVSGTSAPSRDRAAILCGQAAGQDRGPGQGGGAAEQRAAVGGQGMDHGVCFSS